MPLNSKVRRLSQARFTIQVPWTHSRCIVCLEVEGLTIEHLIPAAIGGRLTARFLCKRCNSRLGHLLEQEVKTDPTVRLLVGSMRARIAAVAEKIEAGQRYEVKGQGPPSTALLKGGQLRVRAARLSDGCLIQDTRQAATTIEKMLRRDGMLEEEITAAMDRFNAAPENARVELSPSLAAVKWSVERLEPSLDGSLLDPVVPVKTAYEFLALHLGGAIYERAPCLDAIRAALATGSIDERHIQVDRLHAAEAKPFHGIAFEGNSPYAKVQVRLFGKLAFRVHFKLLSVGGSRASYTHDLESNEEDVVEMAPNDA